MTDTAYLGMRPGDPDDTPYAKFWRPGMSPLPRVFLTTPVRFAGLCPNEPNGYLKVIEADALDRDDFMLIRPITNALIQVV